MYIPKLPEKEVLTLRDQFAMAALQGLLAHGHSAPRYAQTATLAYHYADKMLLSRKFTKETDTN